MNFFQLYVFSTLVIVTLISLILSIKWKSSLNIMQGMTISMYLGMNSGLTAGILIGSMFQGNLFTSTLLSIAIGIVSGLFSGACFGLIAAIEGVMSGLMGGMMGAMLGEMISGPEAMELIKILLVLTLCIIFVYPIFLEKEKTIIYNRFWLLKPIGAFIFVMCFFSIGNILSANAEKTIIYNHSNSIDIEKYNEKQTLIIETMNMKYLPKSVVIEKGKPVELLLKNSDMIEHDIEVKTTNFLLIGNAEKDHNHGQQHGKTDEVFHLHAKEKTTNEVTFLALESGVYHFYCTIAGHREAGMEGQIIVK